jgi:hypothetical protein
LKDFIIEKVYGNENTDSRDILLVQPLHQIIRHLISFNKNIVSIKMSFVIKRLCALKNRILINSYYNLESNLLKKYYFLQMINTDNYFT